MPDLGRVHRFRDHALAGVNWRPTRFVDEVHSSRVCGLCRMIPKRTVLLPCSHVLCQSCYTANSQECGGRCPLDREPFDEAECASYDLPTRTANAFKVHCWNETLGCEFEGAVEIMLRHYENECTFHTVECLRCGEKVLHRELSTHYVAGCSAVISSSRAETASPDSHALTLEDVTAALEELKKLLRDANHEHLLLAMQSQMNELTEQVRNQESRPAENTEPVAAPATSEMAQVTAPSTATSLQEVTSGENPTEEVSTSSTLRSCSMETSAPREHEPFAHLSREVLQAMRKTISQDYPQHAITYFITRVECNLRLTRPLSTTVTWREVLGTATYVLTLANFPIYGPFSGSTFAVITVLHTRDAYFTVELFRRKSDVCVGITFHGMLGDYTCPAPVLVVEAYNLSTGKNVLMNRADEACDCEHDTGSWIHCRRIYYTDINFLISTGILTHGLTFEIELCRQ